MQNGVNVIVDLETVKNLSPSIYLLLVVRPTMKQDVYSI